MATTQKDIELPTPDIRKSLECTFFSFFSLPMQKQGHK
jgi:hypothetical protein